MEPHPFLDKDGEYENRIESLRIDCNRVENAEIIANKFNDYFTNFTLAVKVPHSQSTFDKFKTPETNAFVLNSTTVEEILNLSSSISPSHMN